MLTKYTDEKFIAYGAPRSGKTWEMLRRHNPETDVIIVKDEARKTWLEGMAKHARFRKPNVIVWKPEGKLPQKDEFRIIAIDETPMPTCYRGNGKSKLSAVKVLDDIEKLLLKQYPYPYADINQVRRMRAYIMGEW